MHSRKTLLLVIILLLTGSLSSVAQVAVKTNLVSDAMLCPSVGIETGVGGSLSIDVSGSLSFWNSWDDMKYRHWFVQPELRYWPCQTFSGSFFGVHLLGGQFNIGDIRNSISFLGTDFSALSDRRYQGWAAGTGLSYGYALPLGLHWNLEGEIGAGYVYADYEEFECAACGRKVGDGTHNYFGPTRAAVKLVYLF